MKKRAFFVLVLAVVIAGGVFAQNTNAKNWISLEAGLLGGGVRYERMLTENWSIGGTVFWNSLFFFFNSFGSEVVGRYYPWAGNFYAELGLGFGTVDGFDSATEDLYSTKGVMLAPGVGWKVDVGQPGKFFINPSIIVPIVLGVRQGWHGAEAYNDGFKVGVNFKAAFGLGYAF